MIKYFRIYELVDKQTYETYKEQAWEFFTTDILDTLTGVRELFDSPITVNNWWWGGLYKYRGLRSKQKSAELGSPKSEHRYEDSHLCNAIDCDIKGYTAEQARQLILRNVDNPKISKLMRMEANTNWLHFDCKQGKPRIYLFHV